MVFLRPLETMVSRPLYSRTNVEQDGHYYRHLAMIFPSRIQLASTTLVWPKGTFRPGKPRPEPAVSLVNSHPLRIGPERSKARRSGPLTARTDLESYASRGKGE